MPLQAEDLTRFGAVVDDLHNGAEGGQFVDFVNPSGDYIEWTSDTTAAGTYAIDIRYALGAGAPRTMALELDGTVIAESVTFEPTGGWSTWGTLRTSVDLPAGGGTLRLVATGDSGPNVDSVDVLLIATSSPVDGPQTFDAEDALLDGAVVDDQHAGAIGNAFADFTAASGQSITWSVEAARDGDTTLGFRYALAADPARPMILEVNGEVQDTAVPFSETGAWNNWEVAELGVTLSEGTNTIRLIADGDSGPNVDALFVGGNSVPLFGDVFDGSGTLEPGETDVSMDSIFSVEIDIAEAGDGIDAASVNASTVQLIEASSGTAVIASVNSTGGGDAITLTPTIPLDPATDYQLLIEGVTSQSGEVYPTLIREFTTGGEADDAPPTDTETNLIFEQSEVASAGGVASLTVSPDASQLYASTLGGSILRWDIEDDGMLSNQQEYVVDPGSSLIGLDFDPNDPSRLWYSENTSLFGGNNDNFTGQIGYLDIDDGAAFSGSTTVFVTGLPRSIRDHLTNSVEFGPDGALYVTQGSNTAMGAPDSAWGMRAETELSAAVLRVDVSQTPPSGGFDVTTEGADAYDPEAAGAPVTVYGSGIRNAYDLLWHSNGSLYISNNGSAAGGNSPDDPNTPEDERIDGGRTQQDFLYNVQEGGYYGHPNTAREEYIRDGGNPTAGADEAEVTDYAVGTQPDPDYGGFAYDFGRNRSPNGNDEYRAEAFNDALEGAILVAEYSGGDRIVSLQLDENGAVIGNGVVASGFNNPLDIAVHGPSGRIYVAEFGSDRDLGDDRILLLDPQGGTPVDPQDLGAGVYSLAGDDEEMFTVDPETGDIGLQPWFVPSLDAPWDLDRDLVYEFTRIFTPDNGDPEVRDVLGYETIAEGELEQIADYDGEDTAAASDPIDVDVPDLPDAPSEGLFSLEGDDAAMFTIDAQTGAVGQQNWFSPSLDNPWDADRDLIYEITRVYSPADGSAQIREDLAFDTIAEGTLEEIDPSQLDQTPNEIYSLTGPDAQIFRVDDLNGDVTPQQWFSTGPDTPWDADRDNLYQVSRITTDLDSGGESQVDYTFEGTGPGILTLVETSNPSEIASIAGLPLLAPVEEDLGESEDEAGLENLIA